MSRHTVDESTVLELALDREDRTCPQCGALMHIRCRRPRSILTLQGPLRLSLGLVQCSNQRCEHVKLYGSEQESGYAMPRWGIGWDIFCWIGQRRFSRHWSVPQIRNELRELKGFIDRGVAEQQETFSRVRGNMDQVREVVQVLTLEEGSTLGEQQPLSVLMNRFGRESRSR